MKSPRKPPPRCPWDPVDLELHELSAIKAVANTMPLAWAALEKITGVDRMSFAAGGEEGRRATDFAEGKRWVGNTLRLVRDMKLPSRPIGPPPDEPRPA
ncbi:MAG TPA: hypothetical protein VNH21_03090 [Steroidobacteraceae bacterium]|nr:hypothetical protein [Steroidobacteraceae bacterium]